MGQGGFDHGIKSGWERVLSKHSDFSLKNHADQQGNKHKSNSHFFFN